MPGATISWLGPGRKRPQRAPPTSLRNGAQPAPLRGAARMLLSGPTDRESPMIRRLACLALAAGLLAGCNTMHGVGQDMSAAGNAVSDTAQDVQRRM